MYSRYFSIFSRTLLTVSALMLVVNAGTVSAGRDKVSLCHLDEYGVYNLISVGGPAEQAHIGHGDSSPGDIVPGSGDRFSFADDCTFLPACPCIVDLPSGWTAQFAASSIALGFCPDGSTIDMVGAYSSDGVDQLNYGYTEQCDGPTLYSCSAGGNTRSISEAQYYACRSTTSVP